MSGSGRRIRVLAGVFCGLLCAVLLHTWFVMVEQHEEWLLRSFRNRWTFRDVPTQRGTILDRHGRLLSRDVPSFELSVLYGRFRRFHPVGAVVHGANLRAQALSGPDAVRFGYLPGPHGPESALVELLSTPLHWLEPGRLPKATARDLRFYCVSVLAALTGKSRQRLYALLREQVASGAVGAFWQAIPGVTLADLHAVFHRSLLDLEAFGRELENCGQQGELLTKLDGFRVRWYQDERFRDREDWLRRIAGRFDFGLAASIGVATDDHPGFVLEPSVERERLPGHPGASALPLLLGAVGDLDRADLPPGRFDRRLERALCDEDLEALVPDVALPDAGTREFFREQARHVMASVLRRRERQGTSGIERTQDARLSGLPGLRLVERDKRARELWLWSALQVAPGRDLRLTIDLDLQELVDTQAAAFRSEWIARGGVDPARLDVGVALVDASTGDVLAVGGSPLTLPGPDGQELPRGQPPGLGWLGPGDLGSVVKPFLMLEQLAAARQDRPHRELAGFQPCTGRYRERGGVTLSCMVPHGNDGRDPVRALSESCNAWFFQASEGLGSEGVLRGLSRFGLCPPRQVAKLGLKPGPEAEPDQQLEPELEAAWQSRVGELPEAMAPSPRVGGNHILQRRAIGYGVEAPVLHVARAYGALATGALTTLGLVLDADRPRVHLQLDPGDLELVRRGLRDCVRTGTGAKVPGLAEFDVYGKTGTAEISARRENNAWFAGFLPFRSEGGVQLAFCAAVYFVPDRETGGKVAGELIWRVLDGMRSDPALRERYLRPEAGR